MGLQTYNSWDDEDAVRFDSNRLDGDFLDCVITEVTDARRKFPSSVLTLAAVTEEVGELAKACLKVAAGKLPKEEIWKEAVQVAAMALRVATEGDPSIKFDNDANSNNQ